MASPYTSQLPNGIFQSCTSVQHFIYLLDGLRKIDTCNGRYNETRKKEAKAAKNANNKQNHLTAIMLNCGMSICID